MKKENAKSFPEVFYGLHFCPGVAEYNDAKEPYRILLEEDVIKNMDPSFAGKPVYVKHVDQVNLKDIQTEADGYVWDSFYNSADGKHWVRFIAVSDRAKDAIKQGWKLSNAYFVKSFGAGGLWHGTEYAKKVTNAEYEHLAIVNDPRYEESIILTPQQFKEYNEEKEIELKRLANSKDKKGEQKMASLEFYKRAKVDNGIDIESTLVELPKSKREMSIAQLVTEMDKIQNMAGYASPEHMVKVNDEEMSVKDLVKKHQDAMSELEAMKSKKDDAKSEEGGEPGKGADEEEKNSPDQDQTVEEGQKDVGDRGGDKHLNDEDEDEELKEKKKNAKERADALKVADKKAVHNEAPAIVQLGEHKVARGKARYGSN